MIKIPLISDYEFDLIHKGYALANDLYVLDINVEVPTPDDLSEDESCELHELAEEINSAIQEVEGLREDFLEAF